MPGWTLTVDSPIEHGLDKLCDALDEQVIGAGGRLYLLRLAGRGAAFRQMYPRLDEFLSVRRQVDPQGIFQLRPGPPTGDQMMNALGHPQSILLLGGTSDIALAIARQYAGQGSLRVVLAARPTERRTQAAAELADLGCAVVEVDLDARDHDSHTATIDAAFAGGDLDIAVVAFGLLGDAERAWSDPDHALELAEVNYTAPVHLGVLLANRMRAQSHGCIVALSSVAGERYAGPTSSTAPPRPASTGFFLGLGEALREHGVRVLVVRLDSSARR